MVGYSVSPVLSGTSTATPIEELVCSFEGNVVTLFQSRGLSGTVTYPPVPRLGTGGGSGWVL